VKSDGGASREAAMTEMIIARLTTLTALGLLLGCSKPPSALDVCHQLETAGVAAGCKEDKPGGLGAAAVEAAAFDLPSVPGKSGQVLRFDRDEFFSATEDAFGKAAILAGPHRYGSKKARIFVQMNEGASLEVGKRTKAVVDAL
jgi:hypothetical protein